MKRTTADACLSLEMLRFVRDRQPSIAEFVTYLGRAGENVLHLLRKAGIIVVGEKLSLNRDNLSEDGKRFSYGPSIYHLETGEIQFVRRRKKSA
jgi:hypothetical protein